MRIARYNCVVRSHAKAFSLVELLVVMGIITLLLAAAFPIFTNNSNSARNASREIIKGYLQQARAHAIASGNATAFAIPTLDTDPELGARSASLVEVENSTGSYIPVTDDQGRDVLVQRFGKLSGNFYFLSGSEASIPQPTILQEGESLDVTWNTRTLACRAIIFAPNGQIVRPASGTPVTIAIAQGTARGGSLVITEKSGGKPVFDLLQINRLTGRARFYQPQ